MPTTTEAGKKTTEAGKKTVWEYYNDRAGIVDRELFRDWNDSLNTLLIFAALFSAILTAFIIESMKLLREDSADTSRDILLAISRQLNNNSLPSYPNSTTTERFVPPAFAVRVNSYFFVSISCSLVAALGAVLALQWVGSYDAGLNPSSAIDRAMQRQLRYEGIKNWRMGEVISAFPVLLYLALLMFMVGLVDWLWHMHRTVAAIALTGLLFALTLFIVTTVIGILDIFSPFRTPVSQLVEYGSRWVGYGSTVALYWIHHLIQHPTLYSLHMIITHVPPFQTPVSFKKYEKLQIEAQRENAYQGSILWLVKRIEDVPSARPQFLAVMEEFLRRSTSRLTRPKLSYPLWTTVIRNITRPYDKLESITSLTYEDIKTLTDVVRVSIELMPSTLYLYPFLSIFRPLISAPQRTWLGLLTNILLMTEGYSTWRNVVKYAGDLGVSIFDLETRFLLLLLRSIAKRGDFRKMSNLSALCRLLGPIDLRYMQETHRITDSVVLDSLMDIADSLGTHPESAEGSTIQIIIVLQYLLENRPNLDQQSPRAIRLFEASPNLAISQRRHIYAALMREDWLIISPRHKYNLIKLMCLTLGVQYRPDTAEDSPELWVDMLKAADTVVLSSPGRYYRGNLITLLLRLYPGPVKHPTLSNPEPPRDRTLALLYSLYDMESNSGPWDDMESSSSVTWEDPMWVQAATVWLNDSCHMNQGVVVQKTLNMMSHTIAHGPYHLFCQVLGPLAEIIQQSPTAAEAVTTIICHPRIMACDILVDIYDIKYNQKISEILCSITGSPELPSRLKQVGVEKYIMTLSKMEEFTPLYKLLSHCISESRDLTILHWYVMLAYIPLHRDVMKNLLRTSSIGIQQRRDGITAMIQKINGIHDHWVPSVSAEENSDTECWRRILAKLKEIERGANRGYTAVMSPIGAGRVRDPDGLCARSIG